MKLKQTNEQFPPNLDEVWPLVYAQKDKAVRALKANFIESVDFQVLTQNGENLEGGRPVFDYKLSLSCLEYFIARKVRPVFDVYRKVFHMKVEPIHQLPQTFSEALMLAARQAEQLELQQKQIREAAPKVEYFDEVLPSHSLIATNVIAKELGMSVVTLNRKLHEKGVIYNSAGTWVLYHKYQDLGYTGTKTHHYTDSHGVEQTHVQTYWTEPGRQFVNEIIVKGGVL
ncbi:MAG: phage antirepressor KilAC domain-containing protein [Bacteroidales bacterium]|nr:phage antirepressor KilAC domain-containing protein [Bacteroidales bacterium]